MVKAGPYFIDQKGVPNSTVRFENILDL